jgi:hypothetical protein
MIRVVVLRNCGVKLLKMRIIMMNKRSLGVIVVNDDNLLSSGTSRTHHSAPLLDAFGSAADISPEEAVST